MGGDWKFLALVTGIDSASCAYSCIWCKCKADERFDAGKDPQKEHSPYVTLAIFHWIKFGEFLLFLNYILST